MKAHVPPDVAVLLATYNGAKFVEAQLKSLAENSTSFILHWIDDHSADTTRDVVRAAAMNLRIKLREWHQPQHCGVPGTFFRLMDCVDADLYLFCDQDDIWQSGKIDALVGNLQTDLDSPVLCFSDALLFYEDAPEIVRSVLDELNFKMPAALEESRVYLCCPAPGQSICFTRSLLEVYRSHSDIAKKYAYMHSWWMYVIALAVGEVRMLTNIPKTLYRQHGNNATSAFYARGRTLISYIASRWSLQEQYRRGTSRQAQGFIQAAATLPAGSKKQRLLAQAELVATIDRRQSPLALVRLLLRHTTTPSWELTFWLMVHCLLRDAQPLAVWTNGNASSSSQCRPRSDAVNMGKDP